MRYIIITTTNDRGKTVCISTRKKQMLLNVYFLATNKSVSKEHLYLSITEDGSLRVSSDNHLLYQTTGDPASKLPPLS